MRKGKKFLFAFMLTFLIALCVVVGVVVLTQLGGDDGDTGGRVNTPGEPIVHDQEEAEENSFYLFEEDKADDRLWQRTTTVSEETGLWNFYPIIPWNVFPGETVVLSVSATNFEGWEADPNFANVELFDEHFDENNAFVSFIMPDEEVSIAALYSNEVPYINFENARVMATAFVDSREHGNAPITTSDTGIVPLPVVPTVLPGATVDVSYTVTITNPTIVPEGMNVRWVLTNPEEPIEPTNVLPAGLEWLPAGFAGGIIIDGRPTVVSTVAEEFFFDLFDADADVNDPFAYIGRYRFSLTVYPGAPPATITTASLPDAMVGIRYDVQIRTINFPAGSIWVLELTDADIIPDGLIIWHDPNDTSRWAVQGTPTTDALTGSSSNGASYSFRIRLRQTNPAIPMIYLTTESPLYTIRIWEQPTIAPIALVETNPEPPPELFDGIANANRSYGVRLKASGDAVERPDTGWTWHLISGTLPKDLDFTNTYPPSNLITISGLPAEDGDFTFTLRFRADPTVLIGWVDRTYTITILPPPQFITRPFDLPDGMDSFRRDPSREPEEAEYLATIFANNFPVIATPPAPSRPSITWKWPVGTVVGMPPGLHFHPLDTMDGVAIRGEPVIDESKRFSFTVDIIAESPGNPNIDGARITENFFIMMWERRYLNITTGSGDPRLFVRRATVPGTPNDIVDVNWDGSGWHNNTETADQYRYRRAVMPGTDGEIRIPLGNTGFIRWEVIETNASGQVFVGVDDDDKEIWVKSANRHASIGGPDRYDAVPNSPTAYVRIEMPSFGRDANGNLIPIDGDVYIRGIDDALMPAWTQSSNPLEGAVGDEDSITFVSLAAADVGGGGRPISWQLISPADSFPPGMTFDTGNSRTSFITSVGGGPTSAGMYTFTLGINLPGSMRLDRQFTMEILPVPGVLLGDVNGDGVRNLADLVMLRKFINEEISSLPNPDAGNIVTPRGTRPSGADLTILAQFFGRLDVTLPTASPTPSPPP